MGGEARTRKPAKSYSQDFAGFGQCPHGSAMVAASISDFASVFVCRIRVGASVALWWERNSLVFLVDMDLDRLARRSLVRGRRARANAAVAGMGSRPSPSAKVRAISATVGPANGVGASWGRARERRHRGPCDPKTRVCFWGPRLLRRREGVFWGVLRGASTKGPNRALL